MFGAFLEGVLMSKATYIRDSEYDTLIDYLELTFPRIASRTSRLRHAVSCSLNLEPNDGSPTLAFAAIAKQFSNNKGYTSGR
jgi:hypothetical protein